MYVVIDDIEDEVDPILTLPIEIGTSHPILDEPILQLTQTMATIEPTPQTSDILVHTISTTAPPLSVANDSLPQPYPRNDGKSKTMYFLPATAYNCLLAIAC